MMNSETGDEKALSDIEEYGCHILHILEDESGPGFSYSIGIEKTSKQPELIVTGLKHDIAQWIINEYNSRIREGEKFSHHKMYDGFLEGFDVQFRPVEKQYYQQYFGWGFWLYKSDDFRVNQLIWPSTKGMWPWDEEAPDDYTYSHPLLFEASET